MMITDDHVGNGESILILNIKEYIQNDESFIILGALNAMMAVGTGAFGAHGLKVNYQINTCQYGKSNNLSNVSWIRSVSYRFNKWYNIN